MAEVKVLAGQVVVELSGFEKAESVHRDLEFPKACITEVVIVDDAIDLIHGFKLAGTGIRGRTAVGLFVGSGVKTFAAIHHDTKRGVQIKLSGAKWDQVVIGTDQPEALKALLEA